MVCARRVAKERLGVGETGGYDVLEAVPGDNRGTG